MGLFQRAPRTPEDLAASRPLAIPPVTVAEMSEEEWYAKAYRGEHAPQLTARAVVMGSVLGFLLAFTNLFVGLKAGWHLGVAITACIVSFSVWRFFLAAGFARTPMTILENNCMQSTASAAGYSTGSTMVSAIPALLMLSATVENPGGTHLSWPVLMTWTFCLAMLGTCLAIPMKRTMINRERLRFPSGLAAASTLQSLYADSAGAARKAKALLWSGLAGALIPPLISLQCIFVEVSEKGKNVYRSLFESHFKWFEWLPGLGKKADGTAYLPSDWGIKIDKDPVLLGAGMIIGPRVTLWMLGGALALAFGVGPWGLEQVWTGPDGVAVASVTEPRNAWRQLGLWFGAPFLIAAAMVSFGFQAKSIARAFRGFGNGAATAQDPRVTATEVPNSWFFAGSAVAATGVITLAALQFEVPVIYGILAVGMTFLLCLVASRVTGETDVTPTGAMGKIMQLTYGVLIPQKALPNLMSAGITSGSASACADLLNDLKSGYLLGANPRRQFVAQFLGIFAGTLATVWGFYLLVPDATALPVPGGPEPKFAAPAAVQWKAVADIFVKGFANFHPVYQRAILVGLLLGAALSMAEKLAPKGVRRWLPSATGVGLGFILPFYNCLSFAMGGFAVWLWSRISAAKEEEYAVSIASGLIAGASLIGVVVALMNNFVFT
jgi:uncharacterized oligopeptide transporter (OPT) family protein